MEKWWNYTMKRKRKRKTWRQEADRRMTDQAVDGFKGGDSFLKGSDEDPAEAEDSTGDRSGQAAIDCLVLYHIGVQEAIKTLCQRES